jgi:hypothetical protein
VEAYSTSWKIIRSCIFAGGFTPTIYMRSSSSMLPHCLFNQAPWLSQYQVCFNKACTIFYIWEQISPLSHLFRSRDSVVSIATRYGLDDRGVGVRVLVESTIFSSRRPDRLWGLPNLVSNGYWGLFPGVKRPGREAEHSPPASAEVKKMWIYASTPPYAFMA